MPVGRVSLFHGAARTLAAGASAPYLRRPWLPLFSHMKTLA